MGESGPAHEVGTFSSRADDLSLGEILSDRDPRFTAHFWKSFQKAMGTRLTMSITFHPQTDGQSERTIQVLEDMLRARVLDHKGRGAFALSGIRLQQQLSGEYTDGTC